MWYSCSCDDDAPFPDVVDDVMMPDIVDDVMRACVAYMCRLQRLLLSHPISSTLPLPTPRQSLVDEGNSTGRQVLERVLAKLHGRDFATPAHLLPLVAQGATVELSIEEQTAQLVATATSDERLMSMYPGWWPLW